MLSSIASRHGEPLGRSARDCPQRFGNQNPRPADHVSNRILVHDVRLMTARTLAGLEDLSQPVHLGSKADPIARPQPLHPPPVKTESLPDWISLRGTGLVSRRGA